jgi:hypothetical protein
LLLFKLIDVGFGKTIPRFDLAASDVDVSELAVINKAHDLIRRRFQPSGGFLERQQRDHRRAPSTMSLPFVAVNANLGRPAESI